MKLPLLSPPRHTRRKRLDSFSFLYEAEAVAVKRGGISGWSFPQLQRWCALYLRSIYWSGPAWGTKLKDLPVDTQCLIWQTPHHYGVFLPLVSGNFCTRLQPSDGGPQLQITGGFKEHVSLPTPVAIVAFGPDPSSAMNKAMKAAHIVLGSFRLRKDKQRPAFMDWLGWCTWDAFYHKVSAHKVLKGLRSFLKGNCCPGFIILDDGWLSTKGDHLEEFRPNATKFPAGLSVLARQVRAMGIHFFGVWHAFQGYWAGPDPAGPLASRFPLHLQEGNIRPWNPKESRTLARVETQHIHRFFQEFHRYLYENGVDLVKVDGQSALQLFTEGSAGRGETMRCWQEALQGSAAVHFQNNLLHCMCHGNDVAFHLKSSNVWRNSDDYFPRRELEQQQLHLVLNAYNALWSSQFCWPDWDMFQSHGPAAEFHAVARSLSGGPVYVSDHPSKQNFEILKKISLPDGRIPAWDRPARVSDDLVMLNVLSEPIALKIHNIRGPLGVLASFHCWQTHAGQSVLSRWRVTDIPEMGRKGRFLIFDVGSRDTKETGAGSLQLDSLGPLEWKVKVVAPIGPSGIVPLGLDGLWNGAAALDTIQHESTQSVCFHLRHGGRALFRSLKPPLSVRVNGRKAGWKANGRNLYTVASPKEGGRFEVFLKDG